MLLTQTGAVSVPGTLQHPEGTHTHTHTHWNWNWKETMGSSVCRGWTGLGSNGNPPKGACKSTNGHGGVTARIPKTLSTNYLAQTKSQGPYAAFVPGLTPPPGPKASLGTIPTKTPRPKVLPLNLRR